MNNEAINIIKETEFWGAKNYKPLEVVIESGEGVWVYDVEGEKYLDMISSYSALSQGHRNPRIINAMKEQLDKITLTSRAIHNDKLSEFQKKLCELTNFEKALPMNTGAEAVETALKLARKWGVTQKGVKEDCQEIIVCKDNFHGRTISIISFSTHKQYRYGFGPCTPGFKVVPFGDAEALEKAINPNTVAFLVEPIQGEGGVNVPQSGYLKKVREITAKKDVLFLLDEIQTGLGRVGKMFAYEYDEAKPDVLILGKALGGGVYPVSAVLANKQHMKVFEPGDHGSTFGGNPLGAAVAIEAINVTISEGLAENASKMGEYLKQKLVEIKSNYIQEVRGKGLLIGIEIKKEIGDAQQLCEEIRQLGVLCKNTGDNVIRLAPPLIITKEEIDFAIEKIQKVLK